MVKLVDVFGVSSKLLLSYTPRDNVDGNFLNAIESDKHIIIYGSSKQGKTALRQKHIPDSKCIIIRCSPNTTRDMIYQSILRQSEVRIEVSSSSTSGVKGGAKAKWSFTAHIPLLGGTSTEAEASGEASTSKTLQSTFVAFDVGDAQSITELLNKIKFEKFIVIENFHYLQTEVQAEIAFDLKTFHEVGIRFIILGIWKEVNYLLMYNGDLQDRVIEIPVEPWTDIDFQKVTANGCKLLNITISQNVVDKFIQNSYGSIGMMQEFIKTYLRLNHLSCTLENSVEFSDMVLVEKAFDEKAQHQMGLLSGIMQTIASKSRADASASSKDPLILPYYLVGVLLTAPIEDIREGISRKKLLQKLRDLHHRLDKETIRQGDLSHLIKRIPHLQEQVNPPFLHFDINTNRLSIIDATQLFALSRADRAALWEQIPNPLDSAEDGDESAVSDNE